MKRLFACIYKLASVNHDGLFCLAWTLLMLNSLMLMNMLSIIVFIDKLFVDIQFKENDILFTLCILSVFIYDFALIRKKEYIKIVEHHEQSYAKSWIYFILYFFLSSLLLVLVTFFRYGQ